MMTRLALLGCLALIAASGCASKDAQEETLVVRDYRSPCQGVAVGECLVTGEEGATELFYGRIAGFDPTWGKTYRIRVAVQDIEDPPADGSSNSYSLIEVLETKTVAPAARFELVLGTGEATTPTETGFALVGGRQVRCATKELCASVRERLASTGRYFAIELHHPDDPTNLAQPLVALSLRDL